MPSGVGSGLSRKTSFETLESRVVFTIDPLIAAAGDLVVQAELDQQEVVPFGLNQAHQSTGAEYVFNDYGFDGTGQTIAVIDSGIAWDHYALGGGFGQDYRVVGGWDFAESDANPYDDGPAGYHGTHVAGIIGSTDEAHRGVASGVDLVGLRVFDDNGSGNLDWVEKALRWVHEHKDDFANPITTVNLSLGVDWNASDIPEWATLEDEFAQLEADNIFVSVAAGNSFRNYNASGLAYPAVSEHVVPVASHGADGLFSEFSQRHDRVLVAPGESIQSTVPGHLLGSATSNSFLGASGTSMASPYMAGASAVLRDAMQFMGYENINQDMLYEHFRNTADRFYDSVTSGYFHRLNLANAVDAVVTDAHDAALANATRLGTLGDGEQISGTIGKQTDVDAFAFTATRTGQLTMKIHESHQLDTVLKINGQTVSLENDTATFDVVAGQAYTFSLSTANSIGHYDIDFNIKETITAIELGQVESQFHSSQSVDGDSWYGLTAQRDGIFTATVDQTNLRIEIYDSSLKLISRGDSVAGVLRSDTMVQAGHRYFVKVIGSSSEFDMRLANQVDFSQGVLSVSGSDAADSISVEHRAGQEQVVVTIAQTEYQFSANQVQHIFVDGFGGSNQLTLDLQGANDRIFLESGNAFVTTADFTLSTGRFSSILTQGDSTDQLTFLDSEGNDIFESNDNHWSLRGDGFHDTATGFSTVMAVSRGGFDTANFSSSGNQNSFNVTEFQTRLQSSGSANATVATGFQNVNILGYGGGDFLVVHGTDKVDQFDMQADRTTATINGVNVSASGIEQSIVVARGGADSAVLRGTDHDDRLFSSESTTIVSGEGYNNVVLFARQIEVDLTGAGIDIAHIKDSSGNDSVVGNYDSFQITGNGISRHITGFASITVTAENGGTDHAVFTGSAGTDTMYAKSQSTWIWNTQHHVGLTGFDTVRVDGGGGNDIAVLHGGDDNTNFRFAGNSSAGNSSEMKGNNYSVTANDFARQRFDGHGGHNTVSLEGFGEQDRLTANGSALIAYLNGANLRATHFSWMEADTEEGHTSEMEIGAVDFWYSLQGEWEDTES